MKSPIRRILIAMAVATACSVWTPNPALAQGPSPEESVGIPWDGESAITESVADIMAREAQVQAMASQGPQKPVETHRRLLSHRENLPQNPDALKLEPTAPDRASLPSTLAAQTVGSSFTGVVLADSGFIPPDSMGAVGPTQILICVNGRIRTFTKGGAQDGALDTTADSFFASVRSSAGTTDPRVIFDRLSQRWFVVMINVATPDRVLIAVSSGPAITSTSSFDFFQFQHDLVGPTPNADTGGFADFPSLGVDRNALYIGVNVFNAAGTSFLGSTGFVVQKSALLSGYLTVTAFRQLATSNGSGPESPRGVSNDDPNATEGYFIGADNASFGLLTVRRITNPGGVPTISGNLGINVPSTFFPANVPAKGSSSRLDALDDRLFSALMKKGSLWTAHNIGTDATGTASSTPSRRTSMRWYEITGLTSTPALNQSGTLFDPSTSNPKYYWVGSVATSGQGHMALGSSYAGAADFAGVALTGRLATDPLGTLGVPTLIPSSSSYNVQRANPQRWGDYSFTAVDPTDDMTMWTVQEICNETNSWGVLVTQLVAPPPALPSSAAPSTVSAGTSPAVVVTGTSASGSGFFDPGPGFPNHIAATVNGSGVVVNSVTYTGPTSITLQLTVAANAPAGARTITLTNPDGQSATSASGILTVTVAQNRASTTTTLASSPNPSTFGQSANFTATVSSGSGTPTGAVAFLDGATNIGSGALNGSGQATLSTAMLAVGSHSITASYGGDANFNTSTSSALTQFVKQARTTTVVTSSANPSVSGQSVAFTAMVAVVSPGAGTPSGSVTFKDGAAVLGTGTLNAGSARFTTSSLSIGSHTITAAYSGDPNFVGSTSAKLIQKVNKIPTTTTLSSSLNPSTFGQRVQFTATVSSGSGTRPNGEAVRFYDGSTVLGTRRLSGGKASFSTSSLHAGSHSIRAIYVGDANFNRSSRSLTQVVH